MPVFDGGQLGCNVVLHMIQQWEQHTPSRPDYVLITDIGVKKAVAVEAEDAQMTGQSGGVLRVHAGKQG